jgi:hypothetical protein
LEKESTVNITDAGFDFGELGVTLTQRGIDEYTIQAGNQQTYHIESSKDDNSIILNLGTLNFGKVIFGNDQYGMNHIHGNIMIVGTSSLGQCVGDVIINNNNGYNYNLELSPTSLRGFIGSKFDMIGICSLDLTLSKYDTLTIGGTLSGTLTVTTTDQNTIVMDSLQTSTTSIVVKGSQNIIRGPRYSSTNAGAVQVSIDGISSSGGNTYDWQFSGAGTFTINIQSSSNDNIIISGTPTTDTISFNNDIICDHDGRVEYITISDRSNIRLNLGDGDDIVTMVSFTASSLLINGDGGVDSLSMIASTNGFTAIKVDSLLFDGIGANNDILINLGIVRPY